MKLKTFQTMVCCLYAYVSVYICVHTYYWYCKLFILYKELSDTSQQGINKILPFADCKLNTHMHNCTCKQYYKFKSKFVQMHNYLYILLQSSDQSCDMSLLKTLRLVCMAQLCSGRGYWYLPIQYFLGNLVPFVALK